MTSSDTSGRDCSEKPAFCHRQMWPCSEKPGCRPNAESVNAIMQDIQVKSSAHGGQAFILSAFAPPRRIRFGLQANHIGKKKGAVKLLFIS